MSNLEGQVLLDRYFVKGYVGGGGMADVYQVWDKDRAVYLAMKVIKPDIAEDRVFLNRFRREAKVLETLEHPAIVRFYGLMEAGPVMFILMDFINGSSLGREMRLAPGSFGPQRILSLMRPLCAALDYAHQSNIVHCDIKPGNILIDQSGLPYLADFGIARIVDSTATQTMAGAGTVQYMPPEQFQGKAPAPTMDIYALGSVLYGMLTGGKRPFDGERAPIQGSLSEKYLWEQQNLTPRSLREINPQIPAELEGVVMKCLEKDPRQRYQRPMDLLTALENILSRMIAQHQDLAPADAEAQRNSQPIKSTPISYYPGQAPVVQPLPPAAGTKSPPPGLWIGLVAAAVLIAVIVFGSGLVKPASGGPTLSPPTAPPLASVPPGTPVTATVPSQTPLAATAPAIPTSTYPPAANSLAEVLLWDKTLLDPGPKSGGFVSLVIDSRNVPHLTYLDDDQTDFLHYLEINNAGTPPENISSLEHDGFYNVIRLNSQGNPAVAHYTYYNNQDTVKQLFYSVKSPGGNWETRSVLSSKIQILGDVGMVLDASDQAYFVFQSRTDRKLWFARPSGSTWTYELIDKADVFNDSQPDGCALSLQMNPSGQMALAYYDKGIGLKYREASSGKALPQAAIELADATPGAGGFPSLAFDSSGNPHIIYYDLNQGTLNHAVRVSGQWKTEIIDRGGVGRCTSLAIDQKDRLHVSYMDGSQSKLKYINGSFGSWSEPKILDDTADTGVFSSIALDNAGLPHIAYYQKKPGQLMYFSASTP
jgi:serine/threonine protein kinase